MSRDPYRASTGELGRNNDRWDRDRFLYERDREADRYGDVIDRERRFEEDDRFYRGPPSRAPPSRGPAPDRRPPRPWDDDYVYQRRQHVYEDERPAYSPRRPSPPGSSDYGGRRVVFEKEREREVVRSPSPPRLRRPGGPLLRRQSSLDTFDRPRGFHDREEYGPPARREDFRPPVNTPIPLPRSRALPPPRRYAERDYYDEIKVSDPDRYGDDGFHGAERVREKEVVRTRQRSRSRESRRSRAQSSRRSRASSVSSSSSDETTTTTTTKSEYPKKGKTRIPARLVNVRALMDLGYPFTQEGSTIVVQRALGQNNIDDLLKLSEDYNKADEEVSASRSSAGDVIEERHQEVVVYPPQPQQPQVTFAAPPPPPPPMAAPGPPPPPPGWATPAPPPPPVPMAAPGPPPVIVNATPPQQPVYQQAPYEVVNTTTLVRDVSPARTAYTGASYSSYTDSTYTDSTYTDTASTYTAVPPATYGQGPYVMTKPQAGQMVLAERPRHRSRSRHHGELVKAERMPNGELVVFEETVEHVDEGRRGVRLQKDKQGRMSISIPKYPRV
ncbi:hypothetical protein DL546_006531 [Coniochaeta pulveracea]|uniref:DUF8035 domain-containing protein n=1 Tax=Coniochaeta pulveracea TaxID=177199 RepID=A0A420Y589_9PEZI|nr:hypothetical protein DL546_006531 [Coniochaeta pulveracea]